MMPSPIAHEQVAIIKTHEQEHIATMKKVMTDYGTKMVTAMKDVALPTETNPWQVASDEARGHIHDKPPCCA